MDHISENDTLELPVDTIYINTDINMKELKEDLLSGLKLK